MSFSLKEKNYTDIGTGLTKFEKPATYKGVKNVTSFPEFIEICKLSQKDLKVALIDRLTERGYNDVVMGDGYVYAKGTVPVLLTAHMDTVHKDLVKDFYEFYDEKKDQHIISSPQGIGGDDRCGIYMILEIVKDHKCSVLFCEDEESGGVGSSKFCQTDLMKELEELHYLIELDRKGKNDAVFYDCDNPEFTEFILENTGYEDSWGSFSDISFIAPECGIAAVNLSCGYYDAHTTSEKVVMEEMFHTIDVVKKLLGVESKQYEYIECKWGNWRTSRKSYDDWGYDDYYGGYHKSVLKNDYSTVLYVEWETSDNTIESDTFIGYDENDCLVQFFFNHPDVCWLKVTDYYYDYF